MIRLFVLFALGTFIIVPFAEHAMGADENDALLAEIDTLEGRIKVQLQVLSDQLSGVRSRVDSNQNSMSTFTSNNAIIQNKYEQILEIAPEIQGATASLTAIRQEMALLESELKGLRDDINRVEGDSKSANQIFTWVTAIVSVLIVIIGLFFSNKFLDLYSNYRVLADREERRNQTVGVDERGAS